MERYVLTKTLSSNVAAKDHVSPGGVTGLQCKSVGKNLQEMIVKQ